MFIEGRNNRLLCARNCGRRADPYDEGTILKQKLRREGTSLFELNCAADGEDPGDRVRAGQGGEDNAYSILKKQ